MKLNDLIKHLQLIAEDTNSSGHKYIENGGEVHFLTNDNFDLELVEVEPSIAVCGCWDGCLIWLKVGPEK